jgi:hypothetical protein
MVDSVLAWLQEMMRTARETYGVNPVIFLVIYLGCAPFWYYSLFRTLRAVARKIPGQVLPWSMVFLVTSVAPFVYVMIFGRNLPWWVYGVIAALVVESVWTLYRRVRQSRA